MTLALIISTILAFISFFTLFGTIIIIVLIILLVAWAGRNLLSRNEPVNQPETQPCPPIVIAEKEIRIKGFCLDAFERPLAGKEVGAYDKFLRSEKLLATKETNQEGHFEIVLPITVLDRRPEKYIDVFIRVKEANGTVLCESSVYYKTRADLTINCKTGDSAIKGPSEYTLLTEALLKDMKNVGFTDLREDKQYKDISFLSGDTGKDKNQIMALVLAGLAASKEDISDAIFYCLFRQNLPSNINTYIKTYLDNADDSMTLDQILTKIFIDLASTGADIIKRALVSGFTENIIPQNFSEGLDADIIKISALQIDFSLQQSFTGGKTSIGQLLSTSTSDTNLQKQFLTLFLNNTATAKEFWTGLATKPGFTEAITKDIRSTLRFGSLTSNHLPLVLKLKELKQSGEIRSTKDLAAYDEADWEALLKQEVNGKAIGTPANIDGNDDQEKITTFAQILVTRMAINFPTPAFTAKLNRDDASSPVLTQKKAISAFLEKNAAFRFGSTNVDQYLVKNAISDQPKEMLSQLKMVHRVFKLDRSYYTIKVLLNDNIHSSQQVYKMGRSNFIKKYGDAELLGKTVANRVFSKAESVYASALTLFADYNSGFNKLQLAAIPDLTPDNATVSAIANLPDLQSLFGSMDFCECTECRSVYSAAAYMVDMLQFLKHRSPFNGHSPRDVLFQRRPDIGLILLNCENTNTELPTVDLACEILEDVIAPPIAPVARQTLLTTEELQANPGYINTSAYDRLQNNEVFPFSLPFSLWLETSRNYITNMGVNWFQFKKSVKTIIDLPVAPSPVPDIKYKIYNEYLKISEPERQVIAGKAPLHLSWEYWGLAQNGNSIPDPSDPTTNLAGDWLTLLSQVPVFLHRTGLTYSQLLVLLELDFINAAGTISIKDNENSGITQCDVSQFTINNIVAADYDRIHRFLRLWKKLGCTLWELDKMIMNSAIGKGQLNDDTLLQIAFISQLTDQFGISIVQAMALSAPLDSKDYIDYSSDEHPAVYSLYAQLFRNTAVLNKADIDSFFGPNAPLAGKNIKDALVPISSACVLSLGDISLLFAYLKIVPDPGAAPYPPLDMKTLSIVYRYSQMATMLGLSMEQLINVLRIISSFDAFGSPENNLLFIKKVMKIQSSSFSIDQLNYVLFNYFKVSSGASTDPTTISLFLTALKTELRQIFTDTEVQDQPIAKDLQNQLSKLKLDNSSIQQVLAALNSNTIYTAAISAPDASIAFPASINISFDTTTNALNFTGQMRSDELATLHGIAALAANAEYSQAVQQFYDGPRTVIANALSYYTVPSFITNLSSLPVDVSFLNLPAFLQTRIQFDGNKNRLTFTGIMTVADQIALNALNPSNTANYRTAINDLFNAPTVAGNIDPSNIFIAKADIATLLDIIAPALKSKSDTGRLQFVLKKLCTYLRNTNAENLVKQKYASELQISTSVAYQLITRFAASSANANYRIIDDYNNTSFVNNNNLVAATAYPDQYLSYTLLFKLAIIIKGLRIADDEWPWWMINSVAYGGIAFNALPLKDGDTPVAFEKLETLMDAYSFKNAFPKSSVSFLQFLQDPTGNIATFTYWNAKDLDKLNLSLGLNLKDFAQLLRLADCFKLMKTLGINADAVLLWPDKDLTQDVSTQVKQAAKAKYNNTQWLSIAKKLQDKVREKKRDALTGFLLYHPELGDKHWVREDDLFSFYLIDIKMGACQLTSRIVQANASIQLFVQRCLMNLENGVQVDTVAEPEWLQWKWMKQYRLWEANVEVFLFPENYIEYGLRDNKTPFYLQFENEIRQNEVTSATAEDAFLNYLENMDEIARVIVKGTYHHQQDETNLLYVFATTKGVPPVHYFRTQDLTTEVWNPWIKINLDIRTEHLLPIVWNRRLFIFWSVFTEKPDKLQPMPPAQVSGSPTSNPLKHWEVQIAWSEYKNGKWQPKKVSEEILVITNSTYNVTDNFMLKTAILANGDLEVDFYTKNFQQYFEYYDSSGAKQIYNYTLPDQGGLVKLFEFLFKDTKTGIQVFSIELVDKSSLFYNAGGKQLTFVSDAAADMLPILSLAGFPIYIPSADSYRAMNFINNSSSHPAADQSRDITYEVDFQTVSRGALVSENVLQQADAFSIVVPHQDVQFAGGSPFFFQDNNKCYYVTPIEYFQNGSQWALTAPVTYSTPVTKSDFVFDIFYHPYINLFIHELNRWGIPGLLKRQLQVAPESIYNTPVFDFENYYRPTSYVDMPYPQETVDFRLRASYSVYNWELFVFEAAHIASQLCINQRFDEALKWYHYIFDPTNSAKDLAAPLPQPAAPQGRYWITKPFYLTTTAEYKAERIDQIMQAIANNDPDALAEVEQWRKNPFNPHLLARLRPVAYQKNIVMNYIDTLLQYGDNQFMQNTRESINIATLLYILAADILGPEPQKVPASSSPDKSYNDLEPDLDSFSNALVNVENLIPPGSSGIAVAADTPALPSLSTFYFCIPANQKLASYWDKVADRLYKIRHCMNIQGVVQQLPLFQPRIDPALLVAATAAGVDLDSVLSDLESPLPYYRFTIMIQKATELCNELVSLGNALLSSLEKKDAEGLALLRSSLELQLLDKVHEVKQKQVEEATQNLNNLTAALNIALAKFDYYNNLKKVSTGELQYLTELTVANVFQTISQSLSIANSWAQTIPNFSVGINGVGGSPSVTIGFGGSNIGGALQGAATGMSLLAGFHTYSANMASINAGYQRRWDEWQQQKNLADLEKKQISYQIAAANVRIDIANKELVNNEKEKDNGQLLNDYMQNKYTNQDLYDWMVGQVSAIYFQSYQLAYNLAKKAERCFRHELALDESGYIQFGYWDSLKKGLLSGERLMFDIKRMESAYLDQNQREYELTKHISMSVLDPIALLKLKENGECFIDIPEVLFDIDFPGHYMRRIKSLSISIPCVAGPYTTVGCSLTLIKNSIRTSSSSAAPYQRTSTAANPVDNRFRDSAGGIQSIATSSAVNDSGLFELNFRDDRYLPFEGLGTISSWHVTMNNNFRQFNFETITDFIIHLNYTSRDGGDDLKDLVNNSPAVNHFLGMVNTMSLSESKSGLYKAFSAKQEFPDAWNKFLHPIHPLTDDQQLVYSLTANRFPYFTGDYELQHKGIVIKSVEIGVIAAQGKNYEIAFPPFVGTIAPAVNVVPLNADNIYGSLYHIFQPVGPGQKIGDFTFQIRQQGNDFKSIKPDEIQDIYLIINYIIA